MDLILDNSLNYLYKVVSNKHTVRVLRGTRVVHTDTLLKRLAPSRCLEATWDIRKLLQLKSCGTIWFGDFT